MTSKSVVVGLRTAKPRRPLQNGLNSLSKQEPVCRFSLCWYCRVACRTWRQKWRTKFSFESITGRPTPIWLFSESLFSLFLHVFLVFTIWEPIVSWDSLMIWTNKRMVRRKKIILESNHTALPKFFGSFHILKYLSSWLNLISVFMPGDTIVSL